MNNDVRNSLIVIAAVVIVIAGGWVFISSSSGVNPPFTVIESHSMQHDTQSEIGVIDTGDLILVKSPDKCDIVSYVEGTQNGYQSFGDYGNVIVYKRDTGNPVIHRAFLWLEYNGDGTWSAPSLENYSKLWTCSETSDWNHLEGTLTFYEVGNVVKNKVDGVEVVGKTLSINLSTLEKKSGYLTVGDSVSNTYFDQASSITHSLASKDNIKSVAWKEIPWLGSIKLMLNGHTSELNTWAANSKTILIELVATIIIAILAIGCIIDELGYIREKRKPSS